MLIFIISPVSLPLIFTENFREIYSLNLQGRITLEEEAIYYTEMSLNTDSHPENTFSIFIVTRTPNPHSGFSFVLSVLNSMMLRKM